MTDSSTPDPRERTVEQIQADFLAHTVTSIAEKLRRLADGAERQAGQFAKVGESGHRASYASIAAEVQHDVLWGFVNLNLDRLVLEASDADVARKTGQ